MWPDLDLLKQALGIGTDEKDDLLSLALASAIEQVQVDVGAEVTEPSASLQQAALLLAVTVMKAPDAPFGVASTFDTGGIYVARSNPNYHRLLKGHRVRFGVA
jgi:uncharacterized phage protein (predicted DNA packaging)